MAGHRSSLRAPIDENISSRDAIEKRRIMLNDTLLNFLAIDLDIGITVARMAARADIDSESRSRQTGIGRRVYDTVLGFRRKTITNAEQGARLDQKTRELRAALLDLGECIRSVRPDGPENTENTLEGSSSLLHGKMP